jgi:hypothetical protein
VEREPDVKVVLAMLRLLGAAPQRAVLRRTWELLLTNGATPQELRRLLDRPGSIEPEEPVSTPLVVTVCGIQRSGCLAPVTNVPDGIAIRYARCTACDVSVRADELAAGVLLKFRPLTAVEVESAVAS